MSGWIQVHRGGPLGTARLLSHITKSHLQIARNFRGGPSELLERIYSSQIRDVDSIGNSVRVSITPTADRLYNVTTTLTEHGVTGGVAQLITDFLRGSGIPSERQWEARRAAFPAVVALGDVGHATFRCRMFAWSLSGAGATNPWQNRTFEVDSTYFEHFRSLHGHV
jgi:hypothetical protein